MQFDNTLSKSTTPGEIDPANISISGGLYYQNNIQIDGFNANNDLTGNIASHNSLNDMGAKNARLQSFNIDASLLESIVVQDSNIGAAYGGFTGGVVEANLRRPSKDSWHANVNYQITQGNANPGKFSLTRYHIDPGSEDYFLNSANEYNQPQFTKHIIRASLDGYITDTFGILGSFNTTQSFIPVYNANPLIVTTGDNVGKKKTQKRQSYTYYLKAFYNPTQNLSLEASVGYAPQRNSYQFLTDGFGGAPNSDYTFESDAWQGGVKALYSSPLGLWTTQLGYTFNQSQRHADPRYTYYVAWFLSDGANWARRYQNGESGRIFNTPNGGNVRQKSHTPTLKSDFVFEPVNAYASTHTFRVGVEFSYTNATKERLTPYVQFNNDRSISVPSTEPCPTTPDNLGFMACVDGKPYANPNETKRNTTQTWQQYAESSSNPQVKNTHTGENSWATGYDAAVAQYFNIITQYYGANKIKIDNIAYAAFVEDDVISDLGKLGQLNSRIGLRFDGDSYMSKKTIAPRLSVSYITPAPQSWQTQITIGANRYYGRNLLSYWLLDFAAVRKSFQRDCVSCDWYEIPLDSNNPAWTSSVAFSKLNIPYSDELMAGISQNLGAFSTTLKYIHRDGKDEIMRVPRSTVGLGTKEGYSNSYSVWSNAGHSKSQVISLSIQNTEPISTFGVSHHYFFTFDYTKVERAYKIDATSDDANAYLDEDIVYDGKLMKYSDRPVDNYVHPYTLRLSTTHSFKLWRTKWLWNNFFRYRSPYERMLLYRTSSATHKEWIVQYPQATNVYAKKRFAGAFTWDMRVGFELDIYKGNTFYMNIDIINVLNKANETTALQSPFVGTTYYASNGDTSYDIVDVSQYTTSAYEVGRQFWLQVGYKY